MPVLVPISEKVKSLAWRVASSREDLHWNQEFLAEKSGVSRSYISNIEAGRITNITIKTAYAIADALGVSRAYILGMTEDPLGGIPDSRLEPEEESLDVLTRQFVEVFQQLTADRKKTLLDLAKMLKSSDEQRIIGDE